MKARPIFVTALRVRRESCLARVEERFGSYVATGSHAMARFSGQGNDEAVGCLIMMVFFSRVPRYTHQTLDSRSQSRFSVRLVNIEFPVDVGNEDPALVTHFVMRGYLRAVLALGSIGSEVCEWRRAPPPSSGHISLERGADPKGNRCCFQLPCRSRVCSTTLVVSLETTRSYKVPRG